MWFFNLIKNFRLGWKYLMVNYFIRVTVIRWVQLQLFLAISPWSFPSVKFLPIKLPLENCQCRTNGYFGHTYIHSYCVLEWNRRALTMVGGPVSKSFRISSIQISLKCTSQPRLRSFYKPSFKTLELNFWVSITFQRYKNTSGYDTDCNGTRTHNHLIRK